MKEKLFAPPPLGTVKKLARFARRVLGTESLREIRNFQFFRGAIADCPWLPYKSFAAGGWAMDNAALYTVFRILNDTRPKRTLEFGLGQSSKMTHQYAAYYPDTKVTTIEHDEAWRDFFLKGLPAGLAPDIQIHELEKRTLFGVETLTYAGLEAVIQKKYDFVMVDGPFGSARYSRSQIIDIVKNGLPETFVILIDDTERSGEQETLRALTEVLSEQNRRFECRHFPGDTTKWHSIICSPDLRFLTTIA